jgi:hypothetical protein
MINALLGVIVTPHCTASQAQAACRLVNLQGGGGSGKKGGGQKKGPSTLVIPPKPPAVPYLSTDVIMHNLILVESFSRKVGR